MHKQNTTKNQNKMPQITKINLREEIFMLPLQDKSAA
jgi:hypothetical protein